jgi:hypothetical protein
MSIRQRLHCLDQKAVPRVTRRAPLFCDPSDGGNRGGGGTSRGWPLRLGICPKNRWNLVFYPLVPGE